MSQKSRFRMQMQGVTTFRTAFPQVPWSIVKNPTFIQTEHGCVFYIAFCWVDADRVLSHFRNRLLTSGWWAYARKIVRDSPPSFLLSLTTRLELYCWLVPISFLGTLCRIRFTDSLFLPIVLFDCPDSPLWTRFRTVCIANSSSLRLFINWLFNVSSLMSNVHECPTSQFLIMNAEHWLYTYPPPSQLRNEVRRRLEKILRGREV